MYFIFYIGHDIRAKTAIKVAKIIYCVTNWCQWKSESTDNKQILDGSESNIQFMG